jgi:peptidyl-prolyl cis-trans isomerase D
MLSALRNQASSWVFKVLLGFLIVSFGAWGIGDIFLGERDPVVSKVGGVKITASQLNQAFRDEIRRAQPMVSQPLDNEQAKQLGLLDSALQRIQDNILFSLGSRDFGIVIGDDVLRQEIAREKAFQNPQGQFDPRVFQQVLSASGFTEQSYIQRLRLDLETTRLAGAVTAHVPVPSQMLDALYKYHAEQRVADYVTVPTSAAGSVGTPSEDELQSFYKDHPDQFTAPELRSVTVLRLDPKLLAKDIKVSDDRLKQEYDSRIKELSVPDRREIEQAVFPDQAQAEAAAKAVAGGKSFADAVRTASDGHVSVVKLGTVEKSDLVTEVAGPAFAAKVGGVSAPVKSPLGWHLLRVVHEQKGHVPPLTEVADKLKTDIATREAQDTLYSLSNKLEDVLAGGATLDEAGKQLGLPVTTIAKVDARGMDPDGKPTALAKDPNVLRLAFQTQEGQESQVADVGDGAYAVVRVSQIIPPQVRPLDEVRKDAIAAWQADKRAKATHARAEAILDKLKGGASLADVAKAEKLTVKTTPAFARSTHDSESGLPLSLTARVFALKVGEAAMGDSKDGVVVARLKEIKTSDPAKDPAARDRVSQALSQSIGTDLMDEFVAGLRDRYTVTVQPDVLAQRF